MDDNDRRARRVTGNAQLLLGYLGGALAIAGRTQPVYLVADFSPEAGWMTIVHAETGNRYMISVLQLDGTEFGE